MSPIVEKLEERWTPATIQTAFVIRSLPSRPNEDGISIDLPLSNLGWTFSLSLTRGPALEIPSHKTAGKNGKKGPGKRAIRGSVYNWIPAAFSFRRHSSAIRWGNTSFDAQLSLGEECPLRGNFNINSTPLGGMHVDLADTPSLEHPLATSCTISSLQPNKVWLTVTISECPLPNGLFDARFGPANEAEVHALLVRQSGDRVLNRSLTTGKLFDVKFLAFSTRSASGNIGEPLPTYASLFVVEERVNLLFSVLREGWTNALAALDNTAVNHVGEILCPKDYEYELDSDFEDEDEDEASSPPSGCHSSGERDLAVPEGRQLESGSKRSSGSLSSFELEGVSDQGSVDNQFEELIKGPKEPSSDHERTVWVKFAAHRTWHAFLWYCYTGNLEFGKLRSQVEPGGRHLRVTPLEGGPPTCSPKSMYRLADLLGDKDLKAKALAAIEERMTERNVLDETFSVFTSRYPDVQEVQLGALMEHCGSPEVKKAFLKAMDKYGSMPHAKPVLSAFFDNLVA